MVGSILRFFHNSPATGVQETFSSVIDHPLVLQIEHIAKYIAIAVTVLAAYTENMGKDPSTSKENDHG